MWINLEGIILSKISEAKPQKYCMTFPIETFKSQTQKKRIDGNCHGLRDGGGGDEDMVFKDAMFSCTG
jgi:hypothetical protein